MKKRHPGICVSHFEPDRAHSQKYRVAVLVILVEVEAKKHDLYKFQFWPFNFTISLSPEARLVSDSA